MNQSSNQDELEKLVSQLEEILPDYGKPIEPSVVNDLARHILTHFRSVQDIREALGDDERPVYGSDKYLADEPILRNELRQQIRRNLNLPSAEGDANCKTTSPEVYQTPEVKKENNCNNYQPRYTIIRKGAA